MCDQKYPGVIVVNKKVDDGEGLFDDVANVVLCIKPTWERRNICCERLNNGFTNIIVACNDNRIHDRVVVRVYGRGTGSFINRGQERLAMVALYKVCSVPRLLGSFENGIVCGFVPGKSLSHRDLHDFNIQRLFIEELVKFHCMDINKVQTELGCKEIFTNNSELFAKMKRWIAALPSELKMKWGKDELLAEVEEMKREAVACRSPVVFCHNDLLPNNVIYCEEKNTLHIIDLEYAHPNFQAFDIATYFCEFAGMEEIDFSRYPSKEYQMRWLTLYAECYRNSGKDGDTVTVRQRDVDTLYVQVNKFSLVSHLYWSLWGLKQQQCSSIDFDYLEFSRQKIGEYFRRKEEFCGLEMPSNQI